MIADRWPTTGLWPRLLALLPVLLFIVLIGSLLVPWLTQALAARAGLAQQRAMIAQLQQQLAHRPAELLSPTLVATLATLAHAAPSATQAVAMVQELVLERAQVAGLRVETVQAGSGAAAGPVEAVVLRVRLIGELGRLQSFLHGLDSARPLILVTGAVLQQHVSPAAREATIIAAQLDLLAPLQWQGKAP